MTSFMDAGYHADPTPLYSLSCRDTKFFAGHRRPEFRAVTGHSLLFITAIFQGVSASLLLNPYIKLWWHPLWMNGVYVIKHHGMVASSGLAGCAECGMPKGVIHCLSVIYIWDTGWEHCPEAWRHWVRRGPWRHEGPHCTLRRAVHPPEVRDWFTGRVMKALPRPASMHGATWTTRHFAMNIRWDKLGELLMSGMYKSLVRAVGCGGNMRQLCWE